MSIFDKVRSSLETLEGKLSNRRDAVEVERLLRERARHLAAREARVAPRRALEHVIVVRRQDSLLGLPLARVVELRRVDATPLPHATTVVRSLFQVRGQVHCLVDLLPLLERAVTVEEASGVLAALVSAAPGPLAIRIDEALGVRTVYEDECSAQLKGRSDDFVVAVTHDLLMVLDIDELTQRPEILLGESAGSQDGTSQGKGRE
ncbi:MAG: chemotaxis protein CheW [Armatimonadetes bacterium]|nr:chemotaxis protein CheW [Armatimonadota bacterium]